MGLISLVGRKLICNNLTSANILIIFHFISLLYLLYYFSMFLYSNTLIILHCLFIPWISSISFIDPWLFPIFFSLIVIHCDDTKCPNWDKCQVARRLIKLTFLPRWEMSFIYEILKLLSTKLTKINIHGGVDIVWTGSWSYIN